MRALLLAAAAVLVAVALGLTHGNLGRRALLLVVGAAACAGLAVRAREDTPAPGEAPLAALALGAGLAAGFLHNALRQVGWHATHDLMPAFRPVLLLAAAVAATHLWPGAPPAVRRWRPAALGALWLVLAGLVFRAFPAPSIDVWDLQQGGAAGLLRGENPYALAYPNRYGPGTTLLAPEVLSPDGRWILAYPYPPLTLLAGALAGFTGDVRWAHAALTLLSAAGLWLLGGRTRVAELAAALVLYQPSGFFLVEQAWTEPLVLACLVALAHAVGRPGAAAPGLAAGLAVAAKQYTPLLLLPFLAAVPARARARALAVSLAVALAVYLPFALWDPGALVRGLWEFHLAQPFRPDSLSLSAWLFRACGARLPSWVGFLAAGLALAASWRRVRGPAAALAAAALAWLVFLLLSKQAFANYYGLAVGLLCAGAAAAAAPRPAVPR